MSTPNTHGGGIAAMPRGGFNASWLDRHFQTDELEYLDRGDVPNEVKQKIITMLDRFGALFGLHEKDARTALDAYPISGPHESWNSVRATASCPQKSSNCTRARP